ncbi:MAG: F0F1 ATP synthase subunit B [Clostridia bacterium]|nr:F0F1 ATP synthase subunit B [Clostridia bacterium]
MLLETQQLEIISVNIWSILISLANLVIIFLLLKKLLFKPVKKTLAARQAQVDKIYDDAAAAKQTAEADRAEYEQKLADVKAEAEEILTDARERADRMSEEIIGDAKDKAQAKLERAEEEIAQEKKKAMTELKDDVSALSVDIAEKLLGREIDEKDHAELIDKFISEVDDNGK